MKFFVSHKDNPTRASVVGNSFRKGVMITGNTLTGDSMLADMAILYGMSASHVEIYKKRKAIGKPSAFFDLGYWNRSTLLNQQTCYRLAVNYWHPQHYISLIDEPQKFNRPIFPRYKEGKKILVVGMGLKSYALYGHVPHHWDMALIHEVKQKTTREIVYYPKASDRTAHSIPGTTFYTPGKMLEDDSIWRDVWAVVTHHSNNAVEALRMGIPAFTWDGAASVLCGNDLSLLENPPFPEGVPQFLNRMAYCQWSVAEMSNGECIKWLTKMLPKIPMNVEIRENV